ncbi:hypothetical protein JTE90_021701 [Oedothorax gibbosus]|uniref:Uncharacterized protein n=1 Tax=Oedothorax gibbosus TaxID=931172 RepID=A0AAV6TRD6_9ARAC|nr:hypothetical protein JTE90_021701 [Oedothorax gibbosus]
MPPSPLNSHRTSSDRTSTVTQSLIHSLLTPCTLASPTWRVISYQLFDVFRLSGLLTLRIQLNLTEPFSSSLQPCYAHPSGHALVDEMEDVDQPEIPSIEKILIQV